MLQKKAKQATLGDIAKKLGISRTTVSLVVNDHPRISKETKKLVWSAIQELEYRPDPTARALATGRSNLLGFIVPEMSNLYFAEIFRGAEAYARERGYHLLLNNGSYDLKVEEQRIQDLLDLKIGGLVVSPAFTDARQTSRTIWKDLRNDNFPIVLINRHMQPPIYHQISADNTEGVRLAMEHLAQLGHRRVAYITGEPRVLPVRQRMKAFQDFLTHFGFENDPSLVESSTFTIQGGYESARRLWGKASKKPTAIMALSDTVALGILKFLQESGIDVPGEVSLMGFDGTPIAEFSLIGISTIETPLYDMGRQAITILEQVMQSRVKNLQNVMLPVRLIERGSTGPVKG
jgi:LacI family transcriptional regulator